MKLFRNCLIALLILLLVAVLLLWFLPVRWARPWIEPQLHGLQLHELEGSIWHGSAGKVLAADGHELGHVYWQLSRKMLLGNASGKLDFRGQTLDLSAAMQRLDHDQIVLDDVHLRADLAARNFDAGPLLGKPQGELQLDAAHVLLQAGWPMAMDARLAWQQAGLRTHDGNVKLGSLLGQAQAQGGIIQLQLHDDGHGPLQLDGQLQVSPLGWRLDATLRARQTDPILIGWLSRLGQPDAEGKIHFQRHGGLAANAGPQALSEDTKQP